MDISNLKLKQHLLMDYLSKVGYCANKRRSIEKCIELVLIKVALPTSPPKYQSGTYRSVVWVRNNPFDYGRSNQCVQLRYRPDRV